VQKQGRSTIVGWSKADEDGLRGHSEASVRPNVRVLAMPILLIANTILFRPFQ
jgi:hypothetical protein